MPSPDPLSGIGSAHRIKAEQYWDVPRSLSPNQSRASAICNDCPRRLATTDPSHRCQTGPYSFAVDFSLSSPTPSSTSESGQLASGSQPGPVEQHAAAATWPRADRKTGRPRCIGDAARGCSYAPWQGGSVCPERLPSRNDIDPFYTRPIRPTWRSPRRRNLASIVGIVSQCSRHRRLSW